MTTFEHSGLLGISTHSPALHADLVLEPWLIIDACQVDVLQHLVLDLVLLFLLRQQSPHVLPLLTLHQCPRDRFLGLPAFGQQPSFGWLGVFRTFDWKVLKLSGGRGVESDALQFGDEFICAEVGFSLWGNHAFFTFFLVFGLEVVFLFISVVDFLWDICFIRLVRFFCNLDLFWPVIHGFDDLVEAQGEFLVVF